MTISPNTRGALRKLVALRRKRARGALLLAMTAGAIAPAAAGAIAPAAQADPVVEIKPQHTGMCLDVPHGSQKDGVALIQWPCNQQANQRFTLHSLNNGYYKILPTHTSGKCLDVAGRNTSPGTKIQQWSCEPVPNQEFALRYAGGSHYNILPRHSLDRNMCVSIAVASPWEGARVEQLPCVGPFGGAHQRFSFVGPFGGAN